MTSILEEIVRHKYAEVAAARAARPAAQLENAAASAPAARDFLAPIAADGPIKLIAEIKKASPSRGVIRADFDPLRIARTYQEHGATCLSVLTDQRYFQGSLQYLERIRQEVELPLLRKDFVVDPYQLLEARAAGADAVLLIAECLDDPLLQTLYDQTLQLGMTPLVELYEPENLPRVLRAGARLIGVNNRDLSTFEVDLEHAIRMRGNIPLDRLVVGESGIHSRQDVLRLQRAGISAMLVGQHLMESEDIGLATRTLLGTAV